MFAAAPLMLVPLAFYNLVMIGFWGGGITALGNATLSVPMLSGAVWVPTLGDVLIVLALAMLFIEVLRATRRGSGSLLKHVLSMLVFVMFLVEFLLVRDAATPIFFVLTTIAFIDVAAGFAISSRDGARDVTIGL